MTGLLGIKQLKISQLLLSGSIQPLHNSTKIIQKSHIINRTNASDSFHNHPPQTFSHRHQLHPCQRSEQVLSRGAAAVFLMGWEGCEEPEQSFKVLLHSWAAHCLLGPLAEVVEDGWLAGAAINNVFTRAMEACASHGRIGQSIEMCRWIDWPFGFPVEIIWINWKQWEGGGKVQDVYWFIGLTQKKKRERKWPPCSCRLDEVVLGWLTL